MTFRVLILGGTGQVGAAVVRALAAEPECAEVVMVCRKERAQPPGSRARQVVMDTASPGFAAAIAELARSTAEAGDPVLGVSCVGVGQGSMQWTEEALKALELGVVGAFASGCHDGGVRRFALLSAAGSDPASRIRYARVMGLKEARVRSVGFDRLALLRPGVIAGNAHTPGYAAWLGRLIPGRYGTIDQDEIAGAFVAELKAPGDGGVEVLENGAMRARARALRQASA
ncbi:MAG: NAD(P)H-binding protein [Nannocystaceae bacterium]